MSGVRTVLWKELRETYAGGGRPLVSVVISGLMSLVFGIGIPVVTGTFFDSSQRMLYVLATSGAIAAVASFLGFIAPLATVVDSFAGERERHTLESLLATPLSDKAILGGKVLAQFLPVWTTAVILSVVGGITAAVMAGLIGLLVLPLALVGSLVGGTVTATFIVGLGSLISLRAPTVKKGQERLSYVMIPIFLIPSFGPALFTGRGPGAAIVASLALTIAVPVLIVILGVVFMIVLFTRFRRDRLVGH